MKRFACSAFQMLAIVVVLGFAPSDAAPPEPSTFLAQQPLTVAPAKSSAPKAASKSSASEKFGDHRPSRSFEKSLLEVCKQAHEEGEITRRQLAKVRIAVILHPEAVREAEDCCAELAQSAGLAAAGETAIDWSSLLDFLKELITFLMDLFA